MAIQRGKSFQIGERFTVTIEKVAHGGHFIARHEGQVLFVRHAIPGEVVEVEVTSTGSNFVRADTIAVATASPDRVIAPCAYAKPGACGGCDFQHISPARQRALKADVITEQFARLARMSIEVEVEEVSTPVHWRTRAIASTDEKGHLGFFASRSHRVVAVDDCIILHETMNFPELAKRTWPARTRVEISVSSQGERTVALATAERGSKSRITEGPKVAHESVFGEHLDVSQGSFWQSHARAPEVLAAVVRECVAPGDQVLDLYGGVGLFAAAVVEIVGASGSIDLIESSRAATADALRNFNAHPNVRVHTGDVDRELKNVSAADVVVLDPPREGAGKSVLSQVSALQPRSIVYVACDPAALARDTSYLVELGYALVSLRAFDLFPMTHHVECVARFEPSQRGESNVS